MDNSKKPEKENPRKNTNFLNVFLITWIWPLLYKGFKEGLTQEDLTKTFKNNESQHLGDELEKVWTKEVENYKRNGRKPRLRNAMIKTYYRSYLYNGMLLYIFVIARTCSPMILAQLLKRYQDMEIISDDVNTKNVKISNYTVLVENGTQIETSIYLSPDTTSFFDYIWNDKTYLTVLLILSSFISVLGYQHSEFRQKILGTKMRVACCSMIYRKILRLSKITSEKTSAGYVVNLLSNDVARLDNAVLLSHFIWIAPVHSIIVCYILYGIIGPAAFVGVFGLLIKVIPVHIFLSKLAAKFRLNIALRTDKRIGIMNELIKGILVIKMYAWEKPFQAVVVEARRLEIKQVRYACYIIGFSILSFVIVERSTLFITIIAMLYFSIPISADIVFSLTIYYNLLQLVSTVGFSVAMSLLAEGLVSVNRIEQFLNLNERDSLSNSVVTIKELIQPNLPILEVNNVVASWAETKRKTLSGINLKALSGKLCAVIGPVGAGKSSLLHAVLGELPLQSGNIVVKGNISYGSQDPWLFTGTVRNNIVFGQPFDKKRYNQVIKICALTTDLQQLAYGDKTLVGERGTSLSGGQKARINLARAVYKIADIYLLDDPLSAVDANVGRHLYNEVIGQHGYLAKNGATRVLVTHQIHFLKEADWIIVIEDGKVLQQGTFEEHLTSGLDFSKFLEHENSEEKENEEKPEPDIESEDEDTPLLENGSQTKVSTIDSIQKSVQSLNENPPVIVEHQAQGFVSLKVWITYFKAGGSFSYLFYGLFLFVLTQFISSASDYFVKIWTQQENLKANNLPTTYSTKECLYIYTGLIAGVIVFVLLRCYTFFIICMRASKTLHNNMFESLLRVPMRFFETNSSGNILNRFSRDMGSIDQLFPRVFWTALQYGFIMFGVLAVVVVVNPKLLIVLGGTLILYTLLTKSYIRPAQDLKRLEGIVRSPVLGHLTATLTGLTTIRVNNIQQQVLKEFDDLQNVHTNTWEFIHGATTTFGLWLDFISSAFIGCVGFSFILFEGNVFAGNVGLALSQSLLLTGVMQYGIRQATESMQIMTCVERILEYCDLKAEHSPAEKPPEKWPENGKIVFDKISYSYDVDLPPVLNSIEIKIEPGWKVGVVGRTGAGKSSLIGALFRLAHIDGKIVIDDIDTGRISLETLRQKIAIIPQDPILFSATIRYNLDPFASFTDDQLWRVLEEVELKSEISNLDYLVTEGGCNFSVGQRQLICLARAILKNNKIFVLDEATANVDPQTDSLIQKTIRVKFANCTVLTIAHRLHTVMDSDRILVIDAGIVKEFDIPHNLLLNQTGFLAKMVEATGENEADALRKIAALSYKKLE